MLAPFLRYSTSRSSPRARCRRFAFALCFRRCRRSLRECRRMACDGGRHANTSLLVRQSHAVVSQRYHAHQRSRDAGRNGGYQAEAERPSAHQRRPRRRACLRLILAYQQGKSKSSYRTKRLACVSAATRHKGMVAHAMLRYTLVGLFV